MDNRQTVTTLFRAIERQDWAAVRELYAEDNLVWHNIDKVAQTVDENLAMLASMRKLKRVEYVIEDQVVDGENLAQRHRLLAESHSGQSFDLVVSIFFKIRNGKIYRMYEYFDTPALLPLMAELGETFAAT